MDDYKRKSRGVARYITLHGQQSWMLSTGQNFQPFTPVMVTSPNEWKILEWDEIPKQTKTKPMDETPHPCEKQAA